MFPYLRQSYGKGQQPWHIQFHHTDCHCAGDGSYKQHTGILWCGVQIWCRNPADDDRHYHEGKPGCLGSPAWTGNRGAAHLWLQLRKRAEGQGKAGIPHHTDRINNHVDSGVFCVPVCAHEHCPALWLGVRAVQ